MLRTGLTFLTLLWRFFAGTVLAFVLLFATLSFVFPVVRPPDDPNDSDAASMAEMDGELRRAFFAALLAPVGGVVFLLWAEENLPLGEHRRNL